MTSPPLMTPDQAVDKGSRPRHTKVAAPATAHTASGHPKGRATIPMMEEATTSQVARWARAIAGASCSSSKTYDATRPRGGLFVRVS